MDSHDEWLMSVMLAPDRTASHLSFNIPARLIQK